MKWPEIDALTALRQIRDGRPAIDVRSPGEFKEGAIPGYHNVAILNDEHRHEVGWTYKNKGREDAIALGHRLVDPLRAELIEKWRSIAGETGLVTCWRGGLRSSTAAEWLAEAGVSGERISGGYKAQRHILLNSISESREWFVVGGLTGCGKTELLAALPQHSVLNLESMACHRGSAFGGMIGVPQPSQQTFENTIGLKLLDAGGPLVVENESSLIGTCSIPMPIRQAIAEAPFIRLHSSLEERVKRIFQEYVVAPQISREDLLQLHLNSTQRISRTLGGLRFAKLQTLLREAFAKPALELADHQPWIESLLEEYYDPMYEFGVKKVTRPIVFEGTYESVLNFLTHSLDRRRA